jgi:hypothetical protein
LVVSVSEGTVRHTSRNIPVAAQTVTLTDADPDMDRYDAIVSDSAGTVFSVDGFPGLFSDGSALQPDSSDVILGYVPVPAAATSATDIQDARTYIPQTFTQYQNSGDWYIPLGNDDGVVSYIGSTFNDRMWLAPIWFESKVSVQAIAVATGGATANTAAKCRLGAYDDNGSLGLSLNFEAGTGSISGSTASPHVVSIAVTADLNPGWSWLAFAVQGLSTTSGMRSVFPVGGPLGVDNSTDAFLDANTSWLYVTGVSGSLPDPPGSLNKWTGATPIISVQLA